MTNNRPFFSLPSAIYGLSSDFALDERNQQPIFNIFLYHFHETMLPQPYLGASLREKVMSPILGIAKS